MWPAGLGTSLKTLMYRRVALVFAAFTLIYVLQTLLIPADKSVLSRYGITSGQLTVLSLAVIIPYLIIWFIALTGYLRLDDYTDSIDGTKDGRAFRDIAKGLLLIAAWMPVSAIVSAQVSYYSRSNHDMAPTLTILNNYLNIIWLSAAFYLIYIGSKKLLGVLNKRSPAMPEWFVLLYVAMSALYAFLVLHDPARQNPSDSVSIATYSLPDWLTVTTIVIPRLLVWYLGAQAVYNIFTYRMKVKGTIYKEALHDVAKGLGWTVVGLIVLRCFQSLSTPINKLSLGLVLLIVYVLLVLISVGYIFIARGAKHLKQIEDI